MYIPPKKDIKDLLITALIILGLILFVVGAFYLHVFLSPNSPASEALFGK